MEKLNLPIIKGMPPCVKRLSMDDYLKFIEIGLKISLDRRALRKQKRLAAINVPFIL